MDREQLLIDLFQAYFDARKHKRNTVNQIGFEIDYEKNLIELCGEIISRTYRIRPSICFIVDKPVKREIFAADFRDRVVHHLLFNYIDPYFDKIFIEDSYSCRKKKGTLYGIKRVEHFIRECSLNYTVDCYILKLDICGYFMSINKNILRDSLYSHIPEIVSYNKRTSNLAEIDIGLLTYLIDIVINDDPVKGCRIKGSRSDWIGLPHSKSLFYSREDCGLPIGNLTSQLFSNVYLHPLDCYVKNDLGILYYGRYVDDFIIVHRDKEELKEIIGKINLFLKETLRLEVHPRKIYLQHFSKGVNFLGATIKPYRTYISHRTKKNLARCINYWNRKLLEKEPTKEELALMRASINSYLGIMVHHYTFNIRKKILLKEENQFFKYGYLTRSLKRFVLKKEYRSIDVKSINL